MSAEAEETPAAEEKASGLLGAVERIGNKVPHPVLMFAYLIVFVIVLSWGLSLAGVSITEQIAVPVDQAAPDYDYYEDTTQPGLTPGTPPYDEDWTIIEETIPIKSLLSGEGIRFIFSSFVSNFAGFGVVAVTFIAMMGAGVAEESGLLGSLIRKLVGSAPKWALTFILILVGVISSVASDAGYLILIPLAAAAFASVGRHPLAGLASGFAGVAAIFMVNISLTPTDAMITEIANESLALADGEPITIVANYYFMVVSSIVMALVAAVVTEKIVEPRLGPWVPDGAVAHAEEATTDVAADRRGSRFALIGFLIVMVIVALATFLPGAPLRDPETGDIIGNTPFMDSLLFIIMLAFLVSGVCYGVGARTMKGSGDVIAAITKTFAGLGGMVLMLLMIAQFIAYFNWTNLPRVIAGSLAELLEQADIGAIPLLIGFIVVIVVLDFIMPGALPKWAIFAPIFVPLFMRLGVAPQTLLAAYRVADSPVNALTPLMVYLPFIVTVAQRYVKKAGIGTVVALMLPYSGILLVVWVVMFIAWFALGIPLGPGYPPSVP